VPLLLILLVTPAFSFVAGSIIKNYFGKFTSENITTKYKNGTFKFDNYIVTIENSTLKRLIVNNSGTLVEFYNNGWKKSVVDSNYNIFKNYVVNDFQLYPKPARKEILNFLMKNINDSKVNDTFQDFIDRAVFFDHKRLLKNYISQVENCINQNVNPSSCLKQNVDVSRVVTARKGRFKVSFTPVNYNDRNYQSLIIYSTYYNIRKPFYTYGVDGNNITPIYIGDISFIEIRIC